MNQEQKVRKAARTLVREFKANKDATAISISDAFTQVISNKASGFYFKHDDSKLEIYFGALDGEGYAQLTCDIARAIDAMLKLPKRTLVYKDERELMKWGMWSHRAYRQVDGYVIVTPCKEFASVNRKLAKIGLKPIPFAEWYHGSVFGKRADYEMEKKNYNAADSECCKRVLAFLKGKKKLAYEIVRDEDFENRDYGIRYETEWSGYLHLRLKFTDAKGKTASF